MKFYKLLFILLVCNRVFSQNISNEQYPVFAECDGKLNKELQDCFNVQLESKVYELFQLPDDLQKNNYNGNVIVVFEVTKEGAFSVQYVDAVYEELKQEVTRVFNQLPKVSPPTYAGNPTFSRYSFKLAIPRIANENSQGKRIPESINNTKTTTSAFTINQADEFDRIIYNDFNNPQFKSGLAIPFSHSLYAQFDAAMNQMGNNSHTASKPFTYSQVAQYHDFEAQYQSITKNKTGWWGKKWWNEHMVAIQGEGYWFTVNPFVDLRFGKNTPGEVSYTYQNTRGVQVQGGLGDRLFFTTSIYESQGRFADYFNQYAESIRPSGGNPAVIPGVGIAKPFKDDSYDFPLAEALITYMPSKFIDLNLGYGRNFLGDGYRSLLFGDGASPYPFFKINTQFWKIKYTNTYMWLKDLREEVTDERSYATKFMANHYLSWNVTKRWNLGLFESVVWGNSNDRGFDMSFVNPIIFYRAVEFASSSRSGNAVIGLTSKYKFNDAFQTYGQFIIDEFAIGDVRAQNKSWRNKFGYQIGAKYFNAFGVENLLMQLEYNHVRPYVYSHSDPLTNYGHSNQSLGHQWGANFREFIAIARYHKGRWFADAKLTYGQRGFDFDTEEDGFNYGGNIYKNYNVDRPFDTGVSIAQGNTTTILIADLQAGYLVNPSSNLKFFGSLIYRNFDPNQNNATASKNATTWVSVGLRADLFNWYFDY